jgi:hypothetical protein
MKPPVVGQLPLTPFVGAAGTVHASQTHVGIVPEQVVPERLHANVLGLPPLVSMM